MRQQQLAGVAILAAFARGSPVLHGALRHHGASDAIVYGTIPAAAPLIIVGTTALGIAASKADWPLCGAALAGRDRRRRGRVHAAERGVVGRRDGPARATAVISALLCVVAK